MTKPFVELVISSPFMLFKGFLMGFLAGTGHTGLYYFNRRSGIETETLKDHLKSWLGFENSVHICLEKILSENLETAIRQNHEKLGMEVISKRRIRMAGFDLKARFFDDEEPERFKKELASLEDKMSVTITFDARTSIPAWQDVGVGVLATLPPYQHGIDATIAGPLHELLPLRTKLARETLVDVTEIKLSFED